MSICYQSEVGFKHQVKWLGLHVVWRKIPAVEESIEEMWVYIVTVFDEVVMICSPVDMFIFLYQYDKKIKTVR